MVRTVAEPMQSHLQNHRCPLALMVGAQSEVVPPDVLAHMRATLGDDVPVESIDDAYHHVLLDQPQAFMASVDRVIARWG